MISAIVLAAGTSSRMGSPKPLLTLGGRPLLERVLETVRDAAVDDIVVVLGHEADRVRDGVSFDGAHAVVNPAYIEGMSTSLQAGIRAADPRSDGFLIVLGDQPFVQSATINTLIERRNGSERGHRNRPAGAMPTHLQQVRHEHRASIEPFVLGTVVRADRRSSGPPGFNAIGRAHRALVGWFVGTCAQSVLVAEGFRAHR